MKAPQFVFCLIIALALAGGAQAQIVGGCFGDDGFNVGCCNTPQPNLPPFPNLTSSAVWGCIKDCSLEAQFGATMTISAPNFVLCDIAVINIVVTPTGPGGPSFSGAMIAKYSRTWIENYPNLAGTIQQRQVWRFMLNGDVNFAPLALVNAGCPVPPCATAPANLPVHLTGSIDYAADCPPVSTGGFSIALNLSHVTGCINHAFFSQRPLAGPPAHVDRTYALVAPANFNFAPVPEPMGPITAESQRSSTFFLGGYFCHGEAFVPQGALNTQFSNCYGCPTLAAAPPLWHHQSLNGIAVCNGAVSPFNSVPVAPFFPTGLTCMSLGTYVGFNPTQFPIGRDIVVYYGILQYTNFCSPNAFPFHAVTGVGHRSPHPAILFSAGPAIAPAHQFVDLQSMLVPSAAGFVPGFGSPFLPLELWNLNP